LREGRAAYKRADIIVVSKCPPGLSVYDAKAFDEKVKPLPNQKLFFSAIQYGTPYDFFTKESCDISGKNVILVAGIARPGPLTNYLATFAVSVHPLVYKDHHYFVAQDIEEISSTYSNWQHENKIIVTTEKDAARLQLHHARLRELGFNIAVLPIEVKILFDRQEEFDALVTKYVESTITETE
jgi:tetraacyldisaccharide 4'-kinase